MCIENPNRVWLQKVETLECKMQVIGPTGRKQVPAKSDKLLPQVVVSTDEVINKLDLTRLETRDASRLPPGSLDQLIAVHSSRNRSLVCNCVDSQTLGSLEVHFSTFSLKSFKSPKRLTPQCLSSIKIVYHNAVSSLCVDSIFLNLKNFRKSRGKVNKRQSSFKLRTAS